MIPPGTYQPTNFLHLSDGIKHAPHGYDTWESTNSALWPSKKPAQNYRNYRSWNGREVQFGTESMDVEESGIFSPPLWTASPLGSPQHHKNHYRSLSPASRTQAIARGQRELMEMVRSMPESSYELSLKDLVEQHRVGVGFAQESTVQERNLSNKDVYKREGSGSGSRKVDRKIQVKRSGNVDRGGFYLKMVFPTNFFGFRKKKKKKNESSANNSSRVSPKPPASDGSVKGVDKEWWKKSISASGESESGASSINSGSMKSTGSSSSNSSSSSRCNSKHDRSGAGCWPFICKPKRLTQK